MLTVLKNWLLRLRGWLAEFAGGFWQTVKSLPGYAVANWEAVSILLLASFGATWLLAELPFMLYIPLWMEGVLASDMVRPLLSVIIVWSLVWNIKRRISKEFAHERM